MRLPLLFLCVLGVSTAFAQGVQKTDLLGKWTGKYEVDFSVKRSVEDFNRKFLEGLVKEGRLDLDFRKDGGYSIRMFTGKSKDSASGTWRFEGRKLSMMDLKRRGKAVPKDKQKPFSFKVTRAGKAGLKLEMPGMPLPSYILLTRVK